MATDLDRLVVQLSADIRKFEKTFAKAQGISNKTFNNIERRAKTFDNRLTNIGGGLRRSLVRSAAILGTAFSVREIKNYADAWTQAGNKIRASSQVAGRAGRSLEGIIQLANESRTGLTETSDLYSKLLRATKDVAKSELEVARATLIVNKAFKAGGAALSEQRAGILQLSQALGSGLLQGDELRSVRENAPLIAQALAKEFGTTIAGLKKLGADGELAIDRVFQAILNAQPEIEAAFAKTNATISDSFTRINNAFTQYIGQADASSGASRQLVIGLNSLADSFETTADIAVKFAAVIAAGLLGRSITKMILSLRLGSLELFTFGRALLSAQRGTRGRLLSSALGLGIGGPLAGAIGIGAAALTAYILITGESGDSSEVAARKAQLYADALANIKAEADKAGDAVEDAGKKFQQESLRLGIKVSEAIVRDIDEVVSKTKAALNSYAEFLDRQATLQLQVGGSQELAENLREQSKELRKWAKELDGSSDSAVKLNERINKLGTADPKFDDLADQVSAYTRTLNVNSRALGSQEAATRKLAESLRELGFQYVVAQELFEKGIRLGINESAGSRERFLQRRTIESETGLVAVPTGRDRFEAWQVIGRTSSGRRIVVNPKGGLSTQLLETIADPRGGFMNVPTLFDGRPVSIQDAVDRVIEAGFTDAETGRFIESFETIAEAVDDAKRQSAALGKDPKVSEAEQRFQLGGDFELVEKDIAKRTEAILKAFDKAAEAALSLGFDLGSLSPEIARQLAVQNLAIESTRKLGESALEAAKNLILSNEGQAQLKAFEDTDEFGKPSGVFRIGFSSDTKTILDRAGNEIVQKVVQGMVTTLDLSFRDLERRIREGREEIAGQIGQERFDALSVNQQAVLSDIEFHYGTLPDRIIEALIGGDPGDVANAIRSFNQPGKITNRRRNENAEIFLGDASIDIQVRQEQLALIKATVATIAEKNEMIRIETGLIGESNAAQEAAIVKQEAINALKADGVEITNAVIAQIDREVAETFKLVEAYDAAADAHENFVQVQRSISGAFQSAISGFVKDLVAGKDATEALGNALARLADRLLDIALNQIFRSLFASFAGGFGGGGPLSLAGGGAVQRRQHGGLIRGPGGPRSDRVPILASNQEFIVNARAAQANLGLLEAINSGKVKSFADGGFIGSRKPGGTAGQGGFAQAPAPINVTNVINRFDAASFLSEAMSSPEGQRVILNDVSARPNAYRSALGI